MSQALKKEISITTANMHDDHIVLAYFVMSL